MLEAADLHKRFPGARPLQGVSLRLERGETLVVSGPSGSGKSTLMRVLAGLETAEHGRVSVDGHLASAPGPLLPPHRRGIAMVFQRPALWPHLSVLQNLVFAAGGRRHRAAALELLARMGLDGLAHRRPHALSAGQAGRVAVARALAARPRYLLLDEPLVNLDPATRADMQALIRRQATELGAGVLWITHDEGEASAVGGARAWLVGGQLWEEAQALTPWQATAAARPAEALP
jgi:ABC-type sugar transport system ATPase subunit